MPHDRALAKTADAPARGAPGAGLLAAGGMVGGMLASSCCIVPLLLVTVGVGGAWIGSLTALEPYRPYFLIAAALLLGAGFRRVYFTPRQSCVAGTSCARPAAGRLTEFALWLGTVLAVLAATVGYWAPLLY